MLLLIIIFFFYIISCYIKNHIIGFNFNKKNSFDFQTYIDRREIIIHIQGETRVYIEISNLRIIFYIEISS